MKNISNKFIHIYDNKELVNNFKGKYQKFLNKHKGIEINNKKDIINIINNKPKSFLNILKKLIISFKQYKEKLKKYISNTQSINIHKIESQYNQPKIFLQLKNETNNINKQKESTKESWKKKEQEKIQEFKNLLKDNTLNIPLNFLNPLILIKNINFRNYYEEKENNNRMNYLIQQIKNNVEKNKNISTLKYLKLITSFPILNYQKNIKFNFNLKNNIQRIKLDLIYKIITSAFKSMSCLISKPIFKYTPDKIIISFFYFLVINQKIKKSINKKITTKLNGINILKDNITKPKNNSIKSIHHLLLTNKNIVKLNKLCNILSKLFKKPIKLDLTRLHLPFFDDNILATAIGIMSKKVSVRNIIKFLFRKTKLKTKNNLSHKIYHINSFLSGIKIRIAGRLMTQKVIPRITTRIIQKGAIARGKVNSLNWSKMTLKNKRGTYNIKVTMSHILYK